MFANQTQIGKIFGINPESVSKHLTKLGLKKDGKPTPLAIRANLCKKSKVWLWDKEEIIKLFVALGFKKKGAAKNSELKLKNLAIDRLIAFTDGSTNTYAVVLFDHDKKKHYIAAREDVGNNNRAELLAVKAVLSVIPQNEKITIVTDSLYVKRTIDAINKEKVLEKNLDIVDAIVASISTKNLDVNAVWVKSHTSLHGNEEADALSAFVKTIII